MATTTTNFGLKKYEGTDLFNPLTFENPNSDDIDAAMFYNKQHLCVDATELTTGTVHALTKSDTDSPLFSFTATSVYHAGDTFTLNGAPVTALLTSGETLPEGAYVIGSRVLGIISGGGALITFYIMKTTDLTPINNIIGNTDISGLGDGTLTGAAVALDAKIDGVDEHLVQYNDYVVTMYSTPGVTPFTHYNTADISGFTSGKQVLSTQPIVSGSNQRAVALVNNAQTTAYVYGTDASNIVLRVLAKKI